jgi:hypothetical protein
VFVVHTSGCADDPAMLILLVKGTDLSNLSPKLYKSSMVVTAAGNQRANGVKKSRRSSPEP